MTSPAPPTASQAQDAVRTRVSTLLAQLCRGLYDRDEPMRLALLSAVAGESIFLLGPPGVGKSLVARRLKHAFAGGRAFEYLMSRFSTPDEIFGPVSIRKLREEDRYERRTEGYLPGSDVIFLDEIWKAGPAIQNALLTVLNERVYRNGDTDVKVDVRAIITASNELPPATDELSPLWDRFLVRCSLGGIRSGRQFLSMITDTRDVYADDVEEAVKLTGPLLDDWSPRIDAITVPEEVLNVLQVVRARITAANDRAAMPDGPLQIYDRRWKKIIRLLRTSAFLNGRGRVNLMDCFLMPHALWAAPSQREVLDELVHDAIRKHGYSLVTGLTPLTREVSTLEDEIRGELEVTHAVSVESPVVEDEQYHRLKVDARFDGTHIKAADFARLDTEATAVTSFFDSKGNLRHRLQARRGDTDYSVVVQYRAQPLQYRLDTELSERTEIIQRKPHPMLVEHWDRRLDAVETEARAQRARLDAEAPGDLADTAEHLFVDDSLARVVRANHDRVVSQMDRLLLRLEKARHRVHHAAGDQ